MKDKVKILMTADTVGGVWTYVLNLCKGLQKYNIVVHLLTMGGKPNNQQVKAVQSLDNVVLHSSDYKLEWMKDPWNDVAQAELWIRSIVSSVKPDLLHFNNFVQFNKEWPCPVLTVFHSCVQTWWKAVKGENAPLDWQQYRIAVEKALFLSNVVIAPTQAILKQAEEIYGPLKHRRIIYNGCDNSIVIPNKKEPFILSAGRVWDEAKNLSFLSEIANDLDWPVFIAGNNASPDGGKGLSMQNVHYLGELSRSELQHYMQKASIFVMPALYEPFGLAILEAAQAGCALAVGDIGTLKEIWQKAAHYFNPRDRSQAVNVLQQLVKEQDTREELAKKAQIRAHRFSIDNMAHDYLSLYKELLKERQIQTNKGYLYENSYVLSFLNF